VYKLTGVSKAYRAGARTVKAVSGVAAHFLDSQAITTSRMTQATNVTTSPSEGVVLRDRHDATSAADSSHPPGPRPSACGCRLLPVASSR
jgi:hypothetical protein